MLARSSGIVLRRLRYGDTSLIVTLLTENRGIESILAKGARTGKSRLSALLQPLEELEVQYYVKPGRQLHLLRSAERQCVRHNLARGDEHTLTGLYIAELVYRMELPGGPTAGVFRLLQHTLRLLDTPNCRPQNLLLAFAVRYAAEHGFCLQLDTDALTKEVLTIESTQQYGFALPLGMPYQPGPQQSNFGLVSGTVLQVLTQVATPSLDEIALYDFDTQHLEECWSLLRRYLEYHFERPVPIQLSL